MHRTPSARSIQVFFVLLPQSLALDWNGLGAALGIAKQALQTQGQPPRFAMRFVGPNSDTISSVGLKLSSFEAPPDAQLRRAWHQLGEAGTPSNPKSLQN